MPKNPYCGIMSGYGLTKTQLLHFKRISDCAAALSVPHAWHTPEQDLDVEEKKVKISLRVDERVAKFYRAMGQGYQARMVEVKAQNARIKAERTRIREKLAKG